VVNQVKNEKGFSLLEVMIALTLFAFFVTAYLTSQGYNVADSQLSEDQLMLQQLCERTLNELIINPPKITNATANLKETKAFEESDLKNFEYTLEMKPLLVPDFAQLFAQSGGTTDEAKDAYEGNYYNEGTKGQRNEALEKLVFEELRKNIEKILWQVRVTVTNKETKYNYTLSTFITNYDEKIQLNLGF
jgi:prepilin-type N-terminal cleavage/methylation domain-containing protein